MNLRFMAYCAMLICSNAAMAQHTVSIKIKDRTTSAPLPFTSVVADSNAITTADSMGDAVLNLALGQHRLSFIIAGYRKLDTTISAPIEGILSVTLVAEHTELEEVTIISSTRNNQSIENSPTKVEVLGSEEISEEVGIKPGNIASILGDVSGVQIQQSSATSGNSNVRIQGLDGRYTQILRDGMPLYDGFSGGFGILSIPPLDLKQIELIKGSASTLYGGGAIGGLVNLISKRPSTEQTADVLLNVTTLKEINSNVYLAKRNKHFGYTLFMGYNMQKAVDVNKDGLSDVPDMNGVLIHPRLYYYPSATTTLSLGYSGSFDDRKGGDMQVLAGNTDLVHQYFERNNTQRHTAEYLVEQVFHGKLKLTIKGNLSNFDRRQTTNTYALHAAQLSYFNEASILIPIRKNDLVAGVNIVGDDYKTINTPVVLMPRYSNFTTGAFAQYSQHIKDNTIIDAGLRIDRHITYGAYVLPRVAAFHRFSSQWAARGGFGMGYKVPNPLVQQNIEYNPTLLLPVSKTTTPEQSYGYNAELNYKKEWDNGLSLFVNQAFFLTTIEHPVVFSQVGMFTSMSNADAPVITMGSDTYIKLGLKSWELYMGYTYTDARNTYQHYYSNNFIPLTPRHRASAVLSKEIEKLWRLGLEGSYTGNQYRYDGSTTPAYVFLAVMVQRNVGRHISLVLNCENLLDYRMSRVESIYAGLITNPYFKPLWAPIDGRVVNLSVRWRL